MSSGPFEKIFCGMGRIPNEFILFSPMENVFPNSMINSENFREWNSFMLIAKLDFPFFM